MTLDCLPDLELVLAHLRRLSRRSCTPTEIIDEFDAAIDQRDSDCRERVSRNYSITPFSIRRMLVSETPFAFDN